MKDFYAKLKDNLGLSLILSIGLGVEFSNFQAMFFRFMLQYRPDWGAFNHIFAVLLSAFLLLCIVIFGIRRQTVLSWFLALLTCVISFSVYSRMELSWQWEQMSEVNFVVIILSGLLPLLVAYTTHLIAQTDEDGYYVEDATEETEQIEALLQEIRRKHRQRAALQHANETVSSRKRHYTMADKRQKDIIPEEDEDDREVIYEKECEECGEEFETKRKNAKYCSRTCSLHAQKRKRNTKPVAKTKTVVKNAAATMSPKPVVMTKVNVQKPVVQAEKTVAPKVFAERKAPVPQIIEEEDFTEKKIKKESINKEKNQDNVTNHYAPSQKEVTEFNFSASKVYEDDDDNVIYFNCDYCGKATTRTNQHSRYCSEVCRISALKTKKKSDFFASKDEFDTEGFIEWTNPQNA
ncbi:MAG: hypothetical protein ACOVQA_12895 [Thermoflexibacteraceae bacterium]